jgi:hypothetical protein
MVMVTHIMIMVTVIRIMVMVIHIILIMAEDIIHTMVMLIIQNMAEGKEPAPRHRGGMKTHRPEEPVVHQQHPQHPDELHQLRGPHLRKGVHCQEQTPSQLPVQLLQQQGDCLRNR